LSESISENRSTVGLRLHHFPALADSGLTARTGCCTQDKRVQFASCTPADWRYIVLYTIAMVLLVLWVLGLVTSFTAGGLLHVLLVVAVIMILFQVISGRRVV
jgi:hypothetical protein